MAMTNKMFFWILALSVLIGGAAEAGEVKKLSLDMIKESIGMVRGPVFDGSNMEPLRIGTITSSFDRNKIVRRISSGPFTFGVEADLNPSVDLGALLAEAMRGGATAMGLRTQSDGNVTWEVRGIIKDVVVETKQATNYGPVICYGYLDVELTVSKNGEARQLRVRSHETSFLGERSAAKALAATILLASQDILARLNREFLKVPPHTEIAGLLANLKGGRKTAILDILRIGLSGDPGAVPVLLDLLPESKGDRLALITPVLIFKEKGVRAYIIDALANLGSHAALPLLAQRYVSESGNARFSTLKAFDYIGGEEAMALVKKLGPADSDKSCRNLAVRIAR
jgi:hypothetical protein